MSTQTIRRHFVYVLSLLSCVFLVQCGFGPSTFHDENPDPPTGTVRTLTQYTSCEELLSDLKQTLMAKMESQFEDYFQCYSGTSDDDTPIATMAEDSGSSSSSDSSTTASFTDTNLQEEGVDEPDIIKTDGEIIFVATDSGIDIFQAWPLNEFQKLATYDVDGGVKEMFLLSDTLVAISSGYDSEGSSYVNKVYLLDVSNPSQPRLKEERYFEGAYSDSRMIDGVLHLMTSSSFSFSYTHPYSHASYSWQIWQKACGGGSDASAAQSTLDTILIDTIAENRTAIEALTLDDLLPKKGDVTSPDPVACTDFVADDSTDETNLVGLYSLDVSHSSHDEKITLVKGRSHTIYASTESVYLAAKASDGDATYLHKFNLANVSGLHQYFGSGEVQGHVNNSFSMNEKDGYFRIATTVTGSTSDQPDDENNLFVLDATDTSLKLLGSVEHIAVGEKIYAVRFVGDVGYIVTYESFDPLFVVDLSDPENPEIQGELEMPGYSTYLHPLGDKHLIGFGEYTQTLSYRDSGFEEHDGLKLATFDISDLTSPSIADEVRIGSGWTKSEAFTNHLAFTFDAATGTLVLPVALYDNATTSSWVGDFQYYGVHIYSLSDEGGIDTVAEVALPDGSSSPLRTILMGDANSNGLYVLDSGRLYLVDMGGSYNVSQEIELSDDAGDTYEWSDGVLVDF